MSEAEKNRLFRNVQAIYPGLRRLHARAPKVLLGGGIPGYQTKVWVALDAFTNERQIDRLVPHGYWAKETNMVIATDLNRNRVFFLSLKTGSVYELNYSEEWQTELHYAEEFNFEHLISQMTRRSSFAVNALEPTTRRRKPSKVACCSVPAIGLIFVSLLLFYFLWPSNSRPVEVSNQSIVHERSQSSSNSSALEVVQTKTNSLNRRQEVANSIQQNEFKKEEIKSRNKTGAEKRNAEAENNHTGEATSEEEVEADLLLTLIVFLGPFLVPFYMSDDSEPCKGIKQFLQKLWSRLPNLLFSNHTNNRSDNVTTRSSRGVQDIGLMGNLTQPAASSNNERRRKKGSRRANRANQIVAPTADALILSASLMNSGTFDDAAADQAANQVAEEDYTGKTLFLLGDEIQNIRLSPNANDKNDDCPICLELFRKGLASTLCAILPCHHSVCLPCLVTLDESLDSGQAAPNTQRECPCCRAKRERLHQAAVMQALSMPAIRNRLDILNGISFEDKIDIVRRLLKANDFVIFKVENALEDMLMGSLSPPLSTALTAEVATDLTPQEKADVYTETQRPVLRLRKELKDARWNLRVLKRRHRNPKELAEAHRAVKDAEEKMLHAIQNAREDAYNRINSRGTMGTEQSSGIVQVDYHSLHVRDAKRKFDELIVPLLPVLKRVLIITGRGKNSGKGTSRLRSEIIAHIEDHSKETIRNQIEWEHVAGNEGVIRVVWRN